MYISISLIILVLFNYSSEIFIRQDYAFASTRPDPLIIDCGSNIGISILYFKKRYPQARIIGFEPDPITFSMLEKNAAALSGIALHNRAVSNQSGTAVLYHDANAPGAGTMSLRKERNPKNHETKTIKAVLLSNYIEGEIDFLKVDIEGMETAVIQELAQKHKLGLVREMTIEYHHHVPDGDDSLSQLLSLLERSGFGYHLGASYAPTQNIRNMQDILILAYRK